MMLTYKIVSFFLLTKIVLQTTSLYYYVTRILSNEMNNCFNNMCKYRPIGISYNDIAVDYNNMYSVEVKKLYSKQN